MQYVIFTKKLGLHPKPWRQEIFSNHKQLVISPSKLNYLLGFTLLKFLDQTF